MNTNQTKIENLYRQQRFLQIGVFTLVTVMVWVGFSLFFSQRETKVEPDLKKAAQALTPNINLDVIEEIERKRVFPPQELAAFPIFKLQLADDGRSENVVTIDTPATSTPVPTPQPSTPQPTPVSATTSATTALPEPSPSAQTATGSTQTQAL